MPLRSTGDHSGEFDRRCKTKHTQREGLYVLRRSELGVEESVTEHPDEATQNEVVGQAHMEHYALQIFLYADNEDRAGRFGK